MLGEDSEMEGYGKVMPSNTNVQSVLDRNLLKMTPKL
jgi:hypothetical protein